MFALFFFLLSLCICSLRRDDLDAVFISCSLFFFAHWIRWFVINVNALEWDAGKKARWRKCFFSLSLPSLSSSFSSFPSFLSDRGALVYVRIFQFFHRCVRAYARLYMFVSLCIWLCIFYSFRFVCHRARRRDYHTRKTFIWQLN